MTEEKKRRRPRRTTPVKGVWNGEAFVPAAYEMAWCDRELVVGQTYFARLELESAPASKFEALYFASVSNAFDTMSQEQRRFFPSASHLRHFLLIHLGYCYIEDFAFVTNDEARRFASKHHKTRDRDRDPYVLCAVVENVCRIKTAYSQAHNSETLSPIHHRKEFRASAEKVLAMIGADLGVTVQQLIEAGRNNA